MQTTLQQVHTAAARQMILRELKKVTAETFLGYSIVTGFRNNMHDDILITVQEQTADNEPMCRRICGDKAIDLIKKYL